MADQALLDELSAGTKLTAERTNQFLRLFKSRCFHWFPQSLFGAMTVVEMSAVMNMEQLHAMRLLHLADEHGFARKIDGMTREFQYCPDCKAFVTTHAFCCDKAREYRERCDAVP